MARAKRTCAAKIGDERRNCPNVATDGPRCADCARAWEVERGRTAQRGYGGKHQVARKKAAREVLAGTARCWRCGEEIRPGTAWHLGHDDDGILAGPEHVEACNLRAAGLKAHGKPWTPA